MKFTLPLLALAALTAAAETCLNRYGLVGDDYPWKNSSVKYWSFMGAHGKVIYELNLAMNDISMTMAYANTKLSETEKTDAETLRMKFVNQILESIETLFDVDEFFGKKDRVWDGEGTVAEIEEANRIRQGIADGIITPPKEGKRRI